MSQPRVFSPEAATIPASRPITGPRLRRSVLAGAPGRIALAVTLITAAAFSGMLWLLQASQGAADARDRLAQMKLVSGALASSFDQAAKFALALAAGDRAALRQLSQAAYDYLRLQAGIQIYGFHTKDIRYLLRMHKIESFDDDISGFRPMVVAANRSRRAQIGVEIGIAGIGVRGVAVVNHDGDVAGTMEVGLDIGPILELVKASTNSDVAVIVVPSLSGVAIDDRRPRFGDLSLAMSTDNELFTTLLSEARLKPTRDIDIRAQRIGGRPYSLATQPLVDFSGKLVGMTIAVKDDSRSGSMRTGTELWMAALCGAILAYVAFAVLLRATLARRPGP